MPTNAPDKSFPVSWDQFHRDARALAWRLMSQGPFDAIICVTRGGLVPAAIVSRELGIRVIETISIESYHDETVQQEPRILKPVSLEIAARDTKPGLRLLVIDDLSDTGKTAKLVRTQLPNAHFAAVYAKPKGAPSIDTFVTSVSQDTWIYFPWDLGLTYQEPIHPPPGTPGRGTTGK